MASLQACCSNCNKIGFGLPVCSKCKKIVYCTRVCEEAHWKEHKPICELVSKEDGQISDIPAENPLIYWQQLYPEKWEQLVLIVKVMGFINSPVEWVYIQEYEEKKEEGSNKIVKFQCMSDIVFNAEVLDKHESADFRKSCKEIHKTRTKGSFSIFLNSLHPHFPTYHCIVKLPDT